MPKREVEHATQLYFASQRQIRCTRESRLCRCMGICQSRFPTHRRNCARMLCACNQFGVLWPITFCFGRGIGRSVSGIKWRCGLIGTARTTGFASSFLQQTARVQLPSCAPSSLVGFRQRWGKSRQGFVVASEAERHLWPPLASVSHQAFQVLHCNHFWRARNRPEPLPTPSSRLTFR